MLTLPLMVFGPVQLFNRLNVWMPVMALSLLFGCGAPEPVEPATPGDPEAAKLAPFVQPHPLTDGSTNL